MTAISKQVPQQKPLAPSKAGSEPSQSPKQAVNDVVNEAIHFGDSLHERISKRAYEHYVERGYRDGCSLEDWLAAEREMVSRQQSV
jgi:hypothetical protein